MKYELTNETHPTFPRLHRIRALRDIPQIGVKSGDLGGWVESDGNLSQYDNAWVSGDAQVYDNAQVSGAAWVYGDARVSGDAQVHDNAQVSGDAQVYERRHVVTVGPVGRENRTVTIHRTADGHQIIAGCWTGTADQLTERITGAWPDADPGERKTWTADYKAIIKLARGRAKEWNR